MFNFENINQNQTPSSQTKENPYFIVPEDNRIIRLSIPKNKQAFIMALFISISVMIPPIPTLAILKGIQYYAPFCIIPILIILLSCKSKIVLIKDKANNRLTVQEKNYFCCNTKTYNIPFEHSDIKVVNNLDFGRCQGCYSFGTNNIAVLNADPNVTDIDNNNIKNTPLKFVYMFNYLKENPNLQLMLEDFIGSKFNNNIEEEINLYVPNYNNQPNLIFPLNLAIFHAPTDVFIKISAHFYMFYNYPYFCNGTGNESFKRLDWIYTNDFERIFIGVVKNDTSYINTFTYNIESIDKFIVEIREGKLCLKIVLKDGFNNEICRYTREKESDLNIFIYLINGQINKINNGNNGNIQDYSEKPEESDNSAPTLT